MMHSLTSDALFERAPTLLATLSPDGVLLDLNARWEGMFGFSRSELRSHFLAEFISPSEKVELQDVLKGIRQAHRADFVTTFRSKYGVAHTLKWALEWGRADAIIYAHISPVESAKESEHRPQAYQTFLDQTGFEIEEVLNLILEYDKILYTVLNPDGSIHYESHVASIFFGEDASKYLGNPLLSYVHPSDRTQLVDYFQSALSGPDSAQPHMVHYRREHTRGSWLHIRTHIVPMKREEEICGFVLISADLSAHHHAMHATQDIIDDLEQQIRELTQSGVRRETPRALRSVSNSIHKNLSEHLPMALVVMDEDAQGELSVCWTNRRAAHWLAKDTQPLQEISSRSWGAAFDQACKQVLGTKQTLVTTLVAPKGQSHDALVFGVEQRGVGVVFQTHEHLSLQGNTPLGLITDNSDPNLGPHSSYVFDWSHELRTPLHTILGYTELLQEDAQSETHAQDLAIVHRNATYMGMLMTNMAAIGQLKRGRTDILLDFVPVADFIRATQRILSSLDMVQSDDLEHIHIYADTRKLEQTLLNVFYFLRHYSVDTPPTCSVNKHENQVLFSLETKRARAVPSYLEPLLKLTPMEEGVQPHISGMALGLIVAQEWLKLMGGQLRVELEGPGMSVVMSLPMPQWEHVQHRRSELPGFDLVSEEITEAASVMDFTHASVIVLIDDDPMTHELVKRFSRGKPYHIVSAFDAARGMEIARRLHPTCIILDVMMANSDGWALLNGLRTDRALKDTPVLIHSLLNDPELYDSMGGFEHLHKPLQRTQLDEALTSNHWPGRCVILTNTSEDPPPCVESRRQPYPMDHWLDAHSTSQTLELLRLHRPDIILWDARADHTSLEMLFSSLMHFEMAHCTCFVLKKAQDLTPSNHPEGLNVTYWGLEDADQMEPLAQAWEQALRDARGQRQGV